MDPNSIVVHVITELTSESQSSFEKKSLIEDVRTATTHTQKKSVSSDRKASMNKDKHNTRYDCRLQSAPFPFVFLWSLCVILSCCLYRISCLSTKNA